MAKGVVGGVIYVIVGLLPGAAPEPLDHAAATAVDATIFVFGENFVRPSPAAFRYERPGARSSVQCARTARRLGNGEGAAQPLPVPEDFGAMRCARA